jgi:hypothetical protein
MAELISRTRLLIGDPAGAGQAFSDDEIQQGLDRYRTEARYIALRPEPVLLPGGTVEYRDYFAATGDWEANEQLYDAAWNALTPAASDRLTGHWTFASPGHNPPVYVLGAYYDVFAAAADLLEQWAAKVKLEFDFNVENTSFRRSQKASQLLTLAREYRRRQQPVSVRQVRTDVIATRW